jgi:hypothetical protein
MNKAGIARERARPPNRQASAIPQIADVKSATILICDLQVT